MSWHIVRLKVRWRINNYNITLIPSVNINHKGVLNTPKGAKMINVIPLPFREVTLWGGGGGWGL